MRTTLIRMPLIAAAALSLTCAAEADITTGLIGQWRFDETSGTTAVDTIGTLDGTAEGGTMLGVAGVIDTAFGFTPSTSDRVQLDGSAAALVPATDDFSVFAWVKVDAAPASQYHIFSSNNGQVGRANLSVNSSGQLFWFQNGGVPETAAPVNLVDGQYHLVGITRQSNNFTLHVDDQAFAIGSSAGAISQAVDWRVGSYGSESTGFFDGSIDDVRVYNRALSSKDVNQMIYRAGSTADVLIADTLNGRVLKYHVDGTTWTQTGVFASSLSQPNGMAQDAAGNVYIGEEFDGGSVLKYDRNGVLLGTVATEGVDFTGRPEALEIGPDGNLYMSVAFGTDSDRVYMIDTATNAVSTFTPTTDSVNYTLDNPRGIAFGPDGNLYVTNREGDTTTIFDGSSGAYLGELATVDRPQGLSWDPVNGRFLATVFGTPDIFNFDVDTSVAGVKIFDNNTGSSAYLDVEYIAGNIYFTDYSSGQLRMITGASTSSTIIDNTVLSGPGHLLVLSVPTPAALPAGLALLGGLLARRRR